MFQGYSGLTVGIAEFSADGQSRANALLAERGSPFVLELRGDATPDGFGERDTEPPGRIVE